MAPAPHATLTTRTLAPDEFSRLAGTELDTVWRTLTPDTMCVLVVEDGPEIVACWALMPVWHVEGVWIAPAYRKAGSVARRLLRAMRMMLGSMGIPGVVTAAASAEVAGYLKRLGATPLPPSFVWRMP